MTKKFASLPYNPEKLPRELTKYYISATEQELADMLSTIGLNKMENLFDHIPSSVKFEKTPFVTEGLSYENLVTHMEELSKKNNIKTSFLGDGLKNYKVSEIIPHVCSIRGLTTAYTPYQPERSQGTLNSLWVYSSTISMLTGFEAVNASLYDRASGIYEAINTAIRLKDKSNMVLVLESNYPGDLEVVKTHAVSTNVHIKTVPVNEKTGTTDPALVSSMVKDLGDKLAGIVFPQVNSLGNLEDVHALTDICTEAKIKSIAIIDPILLATGGLVPPSEFGSGKQGADIFVGEGQHLAIGPNFGGPGLGIFGIRFNEKNKNDIRSTPGRYVGKAKDANDLDCLAMVLSTREQHIRREKATSNICSNQSFLATLVGAGILARGENGMTKSIQIAREMAINTAEKLCNFKGVRLAFPQTDFFNEFVLELNISAADVIKKARANGIHLGVDVSGRVSGGRNLLLLSFFDVHTKNDCDKLVNFFSQNFEKENSTSKIKDLNPIFKRTTPVNLPNIPMEEIKKFYSDLGAQNVSPDDSIYPLGSCTMKYNPYINDYAASLPGFTDLHPQAPEEDAQGSLEILFEIQEMFKGITGLAAVTTQPVAGAQGELVGIKLFQAYHKEKGEAKKRDIILIPRTAHGTNPATATMAGFETKVVDGIKHGIITVEANELGQIDLSQLANLIEYYNSRIAGIMVTNPNTSGIFEKEFHTMAKMIHSVGGLVYMDGANMNAISGWVDLEKLGVDAVHNNLHKTWTIPHGGGGPGDGIVAVSEKLVDFLPGIQVVKENGKFKTVIPKKSIGSFHRHFGNFAHKVRAYTYIKALGSEGVRQMSAVAVLSARYLYQNLSEIYPTLPPKAHNEPKMHEFIITIGQEMFKNLEQNGTSRATAIPRIGKLFLDFGLHAPTVAFPEVYGLMIEPTESFSKRELDHFCEIVRAIYKIVMETPEVLTTVPHFTPVGKVDEVEANKNLVLSEKLTKLPQVLKNKIEPGKLSHMDVGQVCQEILKAHKASPRV
jgi:glycine dehydrogenase